jgi:hypothetical protein
MLILLKENIHENEVLENMLQKFVIYKEELNRIKLPRIRYMVVHSEFKNFMNETLNKDSFLRDAK